MVMRRRGVSPLPCTPQAAPPARAVVDRGRARDLGDGLSERISPRRLGFVPHSEWGGGDCDVRSVISEHLGRRSTQRVRFEHKLWNALSLTRCLPHLFLFIGVMWINPFVIKVDREVFGRAMGLSRPNVSLFNPQGSFRTHGFREVSVCEALRCGVCPDQLWSVDEVKVRLFAHNLGSFNALSALDMSACRLAEPRGS